MSVVYLSGPISLGGTCSPEDVATFTEQFARQASRLREKGWEVINPCECEPQPSWEAYMRLGIAAVCRADVVAVLPRWEESRGARLEVLVARELRVLVADVAELGAAYRTPARRDSGCGTGTDAT